MDDVARISDQFREVKNHLTSLLNGVLPSYQITPIMMYTLEFLRKHPDARAIDIATEFGLTRGAITQLLDKLEAQELVERQPHPTSRRSLQIRFTDKGRTVIEAILSDYRAGIGRLFSAYSAEELTELRKLLDTLPI